ATAGVRLVAPLPPGFALETVYTATPAGDANREAAAFVQRLASDATRPARSHAGFQGHAIRAATRDDADAIRALVGEVLQEFALVLDPRGTDSDLADPIASYAARGGTFEVASDAEGALAGCCGVYPLGDGCVELRKMYVRRSA